MWGNMLCSNGEDENYSEVCYLLYSGHHYDCLAFSNKKDMKTRFQRSSLEDAPIISKITAYINEMKPVSLPVSTTPFMMDCLSCDFRALSQEETQHHANTTNHPRFIFVKGCHVSQRLMRQVAFDNVSEDDLSFAAQTVEDYSKDIVIDNHW